MQSQEPKSGEVQQQWNVEAWEENGRAPFQAWFEKLSEYDQAVVDAVVTHIIARLGIGVCETEWGKSLGEGLFEVRIRRSLNAILSWGKPASEDEIPVVGGDQTVLLRLFCTFHGDKVVLLFQGYDKGKDPSERRQRREIKRARKMLKAWRRGS